MDGQSFDSGKPNLLGLIEKYVEGQEVSPFLPPHIRQLLTIQEQFVSEMLPSGGSISGAWPQSPEQPKASLDKKQLSWRTWAWVHIMNLVPCVVDHA